MATEAEKRKIRQRLESYENKTNHMYLDSKGYIRIGFEHLIMNVTIAQQLDFKTKQKTNATENEIKADYNAVKSQPANRIASSYKKHTKLTLSNTEVDQLTNQYIDSLEKALNTIFNKIEDYPSEVRLALFDLIHKLGEANLRNKWPAFNSAIIAEDWHRAAEESIQTAKSFATRNHYAKDLLELAATETTDTAI